MKRHEPEIPPVITQTFDAPLVSIITVVFRDPAGLRRTLHSLVGLPDDYELVVVEGEAASVGSARQVIDELAPRRPVRVVQGRDRGPYDAMNRGLLASAGEWAWFVNAGDEVVAGQHLNDLDAVLRECSSAWVVGIAEVAEEGRVKNKAFPGYREMRTGADSPCHQAILVRTSAVMVTGLFHARYKISADYRMMCQLSNIDHPFVLEVPLARFYRGGLSEKRWKRRELENFMVRARIVRPPFPVILRDFLRLARRVTKPARSVHTSWSSQSGVK